MDNSLTVAIHQPNYLPWLGYFFKMMKADVFVFLDTAQFTKNSYQNRVKIKTPAGEQWLTQPVVLADRAFKPTDQVIFANAAWKKSHAKSLQANYGKSRYFKDYYDQIAEYLEDPEMKLSKFNEKLIGWAAQVLGLEVKFISAADHPSDQTGTERLVELVKLAGGTKYLSGKGGVNYQDPQLFEQAGIILEVVEYNPVPYSQLWGEFIPGLSIIDLIFNCGPEARKYIS